MRSREGRGPPQFQRFGAVPVSPRNIFKLLQRGVPWEGWSRVTMFTRLLTYCRTFWYFLCRTFWYFLHLFASLLDRCYGKNGSGFTVSLWRMWLFEASLLWLFTFKIFPCLKMSWTGSWLTGEMVLLFPGGIREALHGPGEDYQLFWPSKMDFVRVAARFDAVVVPFGGIGADDSAQAREWRCWPAFMASLGNLMSVCDLIFPLNWCWGRSHGKVKTGPEIFLQGQHMKMWIRVVASNTYLFCRWFGTRCPCRFWLTLGSCARRPRRSCPSWHVVRSVPVDWCPCRSLWCLGVSRRFPTSWPTSAVGVVRKSSQALFRHVWIEPSFFWPQVCCLSSSMFMACHSTCALRDAKVFVLNSLHPFIKKGPTGISLNHPRKHWLAEEGGLGFPLIAPRLVPATQTAPGFGDRFYFSALEKKWMDHASTKHCILGTKKFNKGIRSICIWMKNCWSFRVTCNYDYICATGVWQELLCCYTMLYGYAYLPWISRPFLPLLRLWKASGSQGYQSKGQQLQEFHTKWT